MGSKITDLALQSAHTTGADMVELATGGTSKKVNASRFSSIRNLPSPKAGDWVFGITDDVVVFDSTAAVRNGTLPDPTTCHGKTFTAKRRGANNVVIAAAGGKLIDGAASLTLASDKAWATLIADANSAEYQQIG